jgi:hypothetical protein
MVYVAVGPNCWGSGNTREVAINRARRVYSGSGAMPYNLYHASDDFTVGPTGVIEAQRLIKLHEHRPSSS